MMRRDQPEKISCKTRTHSQTTRQHKKLVDKLHVRKSFQNEWPKSGKICIQCTQIFPIWKDLHWKDLRPPTVLSSKVELPKEQTNFQLSTLTNS